MEDILAPYITPLDPVLEWLGSHLRFLAPGTGVGRLSAEKLWYLSPEQHVLDLIIANIFFGSLLIATIRSGRGKAPKQVVEASDVMQWHPLTKVFRILLTLCFFATIRFKINGGKLAMMFMPCHFATVCYLLCLWSRSKAFAEFMFNITIHYMFFTWLALALPDNSELKQTGEILNFWVHHWTLFAIPFVILAVERFEISNYGHYYFRLAVGIAGLVFFDAMTLAGIVAGDNVGYMIVPPPKTPFKGRFFRWQTAMFLLVMGFVCAYPIPWVFHAVKKRFFPHHFANGTQNVQVEEKKVR